jgi:hypothetical protein
VIPFWEPAEVKAGIRFASLLLFPWLPLMSKLIRIIPENRSRTTFSDPACFDFCGERGIRTPGTVTRTAV